MYAATGGIMIVLISRCLLGEKCRYDGGAKPCAAAIRFSKENECVPVCPEALSGLDIPRSPCEICGGDGNDVLCGKARVVASDGKDRTDEFIAGARSVLETAKICGAEVAVFKARSPSCGCGSIYDGTFSGMLRSGDGVAAALLRQNGIRVVTEEELDGSLGKES